MNKWLLRASLVALALVGFSAQSSPAHAVSIIHVNFDLAGAGGAPVAVTNQFAAQGILFSDLVIDDFCGGHYCGVVQEITVGATAYHSPVSLTFSESGDDAFTSFFSVTLSDSNIGSGLIEIALFDLSGASLALRTFVTPASGVRTITACASGCDITVSPEIHRVVLTDPFEGDGTVIEALSFEAVQAPAPLPVPEPGTAAILGLGLALLSLSRRP
jgi:hypothetical protein